MRSVARHLKEWALVALLLVFAAVLVATGMADRDSDLIAAGFAIVIAVLGGIVLYLRVSGLLSG